MHVYIDAKGVRLQVSQDSCIQTFVGRDEFMCVSWFIHMFVTWLHHICDMPHSYVWHDSCKCVIWLVDMSWYVRHDSSTCEPGLLISVPWRIRICNMTHAHAWHDSLICVTGIIHMCDMLLFLVSWFQDWSMSMCICSHVENVQTCACPCACACARVRACLCVWSVYATSTFDASKCVSEKIFIDNNMIILFWNPWK